MARNSEYHSLPGVDCYDIQRDVRTFSGGVPVVAHPPCRAWSAYCAHQAKPLPGEMELGFLCADWLRKFGGVLEHPAHSRLFAAAGLPDPLESSLPDPLESSQDGIWTAEVLQSWWGDTRTKETWLCFSGIDKRSVQFPIRLHNPTGDRRRWQLLSKKARSKTTPELAAWLVDAARRSQKVTAVSPS